MNLKMSSNWGDANISENSSEYIFFQFLINHCKKLFQLQFADIHLLRLCLLCLFIASYRLKGRQQLMWFATHWGSLVVL